MVYVEFGKRLAVGYRLLAHGEHREVVLEAVFLHQVVERFAAPLALVAVVVLLVAVEKPLAQRQQHHNAHHDAHNAHGQETEELERLKAVLGQRLLNHKVGRRTDEREHSAHAAGKGEGHEQSAGAHLGFLGEAHHDGHHQSHRARVADEGPYHGCHHHEQQKQAQFAVACQGHQLARRLFGQARLHNGTTHNKQSHHHYHHRVGKSRKGFLRSEDSGEQ